MSVSISGDLEDLSVDDDAAPASASTRFPNEVVENIAHLTTDSATLASWMRVSRTMYNIAAPRLYIEGVVTRNGSLYVGCEEEVGRSWSARKRQKANNSDEPIEAIAGLFESEEDLTGQHTPITLSYSKTQLFSMIRHLYVHEIPSTNVYKEHIALLQRNKSAGKSGTIMVSIRPRAVGQLMKSAVDLSLSHHSHRWRDPHDFVRYLANFDIDHMCVQLPVMDQHFEDSLVPNRTMPRSIFQIEIIRQRLRHLLISDRYHVSNNFFGLFKLTSRTLTIHNMTLGLYDRALDAVLSGRACTLRAFFRPRTNADSDLVDKVFDRYCYNHLTDRKPIINDNGDINLGSKTIRSDNPLELIDIDWRRGAYEPNRSDEPSRSLNRQIQLQVEESSPRSYSWDSENQTLKRRPAIPKSIKMSREVEACSCCGRHQLSAAEVCLVANHAVEDLGNGTELDQLHRPEV